MSDIDPMRSLAAVLGGGPDGNCAVVVKGVVAVVPAITFSNVPHTVTVTLSGDSTQIAGVRFLNSYSPLVGDTVLMVKQGSDLFIIGQMSMAQPAGNGWTQPVLGGGFTHDSNDPIQYRVVYDHGSPKVQLRGGATISGSPTTVFTMPAAFRPLTNKTPIVIARGSASPNTGSNSALLTVQSTGVMLLSGGTVGIAGYNGTLTTGIDGGNAATDPGGAMNTSNVLGPPFNVSGTPTTDGPFNDDTGINHVHIMTHYHSIGSHTHLGGEHQHPLYNVAYPTSISLNGVEYFL